MIASRLAVPGDNNNQAGPLFGQSIWQRLLMPTGSLPEYSTRIGNSKPI
ncbi:hypothetical protein [Paraburkholderia graminis]|jgi:hypothetical protein|nr:hypothetical protein [Paraburkholderia graminis]